MSRSGNKSDGGGWHVTGDAETCQTALREINLTEREKAKQEKEAKQEVTKQKKAEIAMQKASIRAKKEENIKAREAAKEEKLARLDNEKRASEDSFKLQTSKVEGETEISKKKIEATSKETMEKLDIEKLKIQKSFELESSYIEKFSSLAEKGLERDMESIKNTHAENMKQLDIQSQDMGVFKSVQFKRRSMGQRESGRTMMVAGANIAAIKHNHSGSIQGTLAITDGSNTGLLTSIDI